MKVLTHQQTKEWNKIVKSFSDWDVYYLCEYAISLHEHGDGIPHLFYYENDDCKMCYVMTKNDISDFPAFCGHLSKHEYYDLSSPYGYGGLLAEGNVTFDARMNFKNEVTEYCKENNIVTQFFRFHPLLDNYKFSEEVSRVEYIKDTIMMDLQSPELIMHNMDSKNRNMIRKAQKSGVHIEWDLGEHIDEFMQIYKQTMDACQAKDYYYFDRKYYEYITDAMKDNTVFFYSVYEGQIIGSAIFFWNEQYMHYHLSGTLHEYRKLASTNLLIYEAALWGCERGIKQLHLGGGVGINDSLFGFKKQFNKNGYVPFYIGGDIFDQEEYDKLLHLRKEIDDAFDVNNDYFIQYRK